MERVREAECSHNYWSKWQKSRAYVMSSSKENKRERECGWKTRISRYSVQVICNYFLVLFIVHNISGKATKESSSRKKLQKSDKECRLSNGLTLVILATKISRWASITCFLQMSFPINILTFLSSQNAVKMSSIHTWYETEEAEKLSVSSYFSRKQISSKLESETRIPIHRNMRVKHW